ncbi:MAG TPA: glycosyltransferase [Bacillota bacterium]|nr:glycosyltransferase [Bacillota bacterium]
MIILFVIPSLGRGGAERAASLLLREWAKEHTVKVVLFDDANPAYRHGGEMISLSLPAKAGFPGKAVNFARRLAALFFLMRSMKPDLIVSFTEAANFPALMAAAASGNRRRTVVSVRTNPAKLLLCYRLLQPLVYRLAGSVVAVSPGVREALVGDFRLPAGKCRVIPNPVDLEMAFELQKDDVAEGHRDWFSGSCPCFLAAGRLHRQKGFDLLLQALVLLKKRHAFRLMILGEGGEMRKLEAQIEKLGLAGRVFLAGAVANPFPYYRQAYAFVLSSRYEGWPNVLAEAMACGCPVISFDCPYGPGDLIRHGETGLLVPPEDVPALAGAMEQLLSDGPLRRRLAAGGAEAVRRYDIKIIAQKWLEITA